MTLSVSGGSLERAYAELDTLATTTLIPALAAVGVVDVNYYLLPRPEMTFPAVWHQQAREAETAARDNAIDRDQVQLEVLVGLDATSDDDSVRAVRAADVLRETYSAQTAANIAGLRGSQRVAFGVELRQFGKDSPLRHVAFVRLRVPLYAPANRG